VLTTIPLLTQVLQASSNLSDAPESSEIPEVAQVDELETFVGKKKQDMAVDGCKQGKRRDSSLGARRQKC
jgi:hypothetical protein